MPADEAERPTLEAMLRVNRESQARLAARVWQLALSLEPGLEAEGNALVAEEWALLERLGPAA